MILLFPSRAICILPTMSVLVSVMPVCIVADATEYRDFCFVGSDAMGKHSGAMNCVLQYQIPYLGRKM